MKRSILLFGALVLAASCASDDEPEEILLEASRPDYTIPDAQCDPELIGEASASTETTDATGIAEYAWSVDAEALTLDLSDDACGDLGTITTELDFDPSRSSECFPFVVDGEVNDASGWIASEGLES